MIRPIALIALLSIGITGCNQAPDPAETDTTPAATEVSPGASPDPGGGSAVADAPQDAVTPEPQRPSELPRTGSPLTLVMLAGLASLGGALALRAWRT